MLWIMRCIVPTLPHEVLTVDVVYPTGLLAHGHPLNLLPAMVSCLQSGIRVLTKSFCQVEVLEDDEGHVVVHRNGEPKRKTPNPCVKLAYTYLVA